MRRAHTNGPGFFFYCSVHRQHIVTIPWCVHARDLFGTLYLRRGNFFFPSFAILFSLYRRKLKLQDLAFIFFYLLNARYVSVYTYGAVAVPSPSPPQHLSISRLSPMVAACDNMAQLPFTYSRQYYFFIRRRFRMPFSYVFVFNLHRVAPVRSRGTRDAVFACTAVALVWFCFRWLCDCGISCSLT